MKYYTDERNVQILIYLLKENGISKVIASPGTTNLTFVASLQQDTFFEIYSCVDERSAAYMACGLAAAANEPVVLTCTGATASRNYIPALTEAYYRKLPILAVTSTQDLSRIGHLYDQMIDRRCQLNDIVKLSEHVSSITNNDEWDACIRINKAILELNHHGGGPVHINLETRYSRNFSIKTLPPCQVVKRYDSSLKFPPILSGRIGICVGNHKKMSSRLVGLIDHFCSSHDAVVFCDHTSSYNGKYRIQFAIVASQMSYYSQLSDLDLIIHIGEVSGDATMPLLNPKEVWRVSEDGELRDRYKKLTSVFEVPEEIFFEFYSDKNLKKNDFFISCKHEVEKIRNLIPDLPFSNLWIASNIYDKLPCNINLHLGILNSLRSLNFFDVDPSITCYANTGGFGIDGVLSSAIGCSFANNEIYNFVVLGDLAFFYDLNSLGNRHIGNNIRILLINNGKGTEFRNFNHPGAAFGKEADQFIAAGGHFGNQSDLLVKNYSESLGFKYLKASTKSEFLGNCDLFFNIEDIHEKMIFEVFTNSEDESNALEMLYNIEKSGLGKIKKIAYNILGEVCIESFKNLFKR